VTVIAACTQQGWVAGAVSPDGVAVFKGIPYAAPPVGNLRWRAPRPARPWRGTRACRQFAPVAIQATTLPPSPLPLAPEPQSEDCLYLNIWTGAALAGERRPVIVWFHPGAYQLGSGSAALFDGTSWARSGAVFVTSNHRLSLLGFLMHPALIAEDADGGGNYGLLDQIAVLEWVQTNIAAFGGDPNCVTIFGVSSGASSVSLLMASPLASGLFHRAIAESGGSFGPLSHTTGIGDCWQTIDGAVRSGETWARALGAITSETLRALSADQIRSATNARPRSTGVFDGLRPVIGGHGLVADTASRFRQGQQAQVPLLVGCAAREELSFAAGSDPDSFGVQAVREHGPDAKAFLQLYPASDDREAALSERSARGHRLFTWQAWTMARLHAGAGHPVYFYRFDQAPPASDGGDAGAFHGASILYGFDRFELRPDCAWSDADRAVSAAMIDAWVSFAQSGAPNSRKLPDWPRFDPAAPLQMRLHEDSALAPIGDREALDFWDAYYGVVSTVH
jgi:para-nitrobenzyl esterase